MNARVENFEKKRGEYAKLGFPEAVREQLHSGSGDVQESNVLVRSCYNKERITVPRYDNVLFDTSGELREAGIGGLVIDSPGWTHVNWIISALEHDIPVFCKQPPILNGGDARRIVNAAGSRDCLLGINFKYRHIKGMSELREHVRRGELGKVRTLDLTFRCGQSRGRNEPLPEIRNPMILAFHLVDLALWLFDYPRAVYKETYPLNGSLSAPARGGQQEQPLARLDLENGAVVRLAYSKRISSCDAIIDMGIYGDCDGHAPGFCNDALFSFVIAPDIAGFDCEWRDMELKNWLKCLHTSPHYNSSVENFVYVAELLSGKGRNESADMRS